MLEVRGRAGSAMGSPMSGLLQRKAARVSDTTSDQHRTGATGVCHPPAHFAKRQSSELVSHEMPLKK